MSDCGSDYPVVSMSVYFCVAGGGDMQGPPPFGPPPGMFHNMGQMPPGFRGPPPPGWRGPNRGPPPMFGGKQLSLKIIYKYDYYIFLCLSC